MKRKNSQSPPAWAARAWLGATTEGPLLREKDCGESALRIPTMAAYAARIPMVTTTNTVKNSTKALNKPPKVSPNFPIKCRCLARFFGRYVRRWRASSIYPR